MVVAAASHPEVVVFECGWIVGVHWWLLVGCCLSLSCCWCVWGGNSGLLRRQEGNPELPGGLWVPQDREGGAGNRGSPGGRASPEFSGGVQVPQEDDGGCGGRCLLLKPMAFLFGDDDMRIVTDQIVTVADLLRAVEGLDAATEVSFGRTLKSQVVNSCWCGCGGETKGRFVPGHDARFHGLAKRVARGEEEMPSSWACDEAREDFMKWHDREVPVWEAKKRAKRVAEKAKVVEMVEMDAETEALLAEMG